MRAILALVALAGPAAAAIDPDGCYSRTYDAAHLASHPDQVVSALAVRFDGTDGTATLRIVPRDGGAALGGGMACEAWKAMTICRADGDAGVMQVWLEPDGAVMLETDRFLTGTDRSEADAIDLAEAAGAVTTYRLDPAADAACDAP